MNFLTSSAVQIIDIAEMKFQNNRRTLSLNRNYNPALYGHVQWCGVWKSITAATEWYPDPCEQIHILMSCFLKFLWKLSSNLRLGLLYRPNFSTEFFCMYTRVNKNPSAWNFLSPKPEMTCGTVAIIIRVVLLSPYLRIRGVSLSSTHYDQSHRVYINRRRQYICLIWH